MPHDRAEWHRRIKAVELEYNAARLAVSRLLVSVQADPTILKDEVNYRDIKSVANNLEGTFIIRLFAEFETGLRLYWPTVKATEPPGRTRDLLDGIAATRAVSHQELTNAHAVREYRNSLIHEREQPTAAISMSQSRRYLGSFFSRLPPNW